VLAADISPVDVLSHIPGICEKKDVPYIWVRSRMELGTAAQTKKPTSVVLLVNPNDESKLNGKFQKINSKVRAINPYL
jgi:H/ACA ribonucleoprotein complex subunit 2